MSWGLEATVAVLEACLEQGSGQGEVGASAKTRGFHTQLDEGPETP